MRVKITVTYDGGSLSRETEDYDLTLEEDDPETFKEAQDYLIENVRDVYTDDGYEIEDDKSEEAAIGTDYLAAWVVTDAFDSEDEAREFLVEAIKDAGYALGDLE